MNPAVSVAIATRNYGHYLADAIVSVLGQTFTDFELLILDDGSTDVTREVVRPFLTDARVRYIPCDPLGLPRAKNLSWQLAQADLLAFLDADDVWLPTKLAQQVAMFRQNPALGVVSTRRELMNPAGMPMPTPPAHHPRGNVFRSILRENTVCFSSVMLHRRVLEYVGGFDRRLDLAVDYELWLRAAQHFPFDFVDEVLVRYRTGHANLSSRLSERIQTVLSVLRRCLTRLRRGETVSRQDRAEAWGSTCRTMAFVSRQSPRRSFLWNLRAWRYDGHTVASLRASFGSAGRWLLRRWRR